MLERNEVSKSCDVYSYGVLLFEIATQQKPFPDVRPYEIPDMTLAGKVGDSEGVPVVKTRTRSGFHHGHTILVLTSMATIQQLNN